MRALVGLLCLAAMVPWVVSTMTYSEMLRGHGLVRSCKATSVGPNCPLSLLGEFLGFDSSDMPNGYECGSSSARGGILPAIVAATHAGAFQGQAIGLTAAADRAGRRRSRPAPLATPIRLASRSTSTRGTPTPLAGRPAQVPPRLEA